MHGIQFCVILTLMYFKLSKCSENRHTEPLIVNGEYAKIENFPHCVLLQINCLGQWRCGSSILNQIILLTAAHCLYHCDGEGKIRVQAFAGHEDIEKAMVTRRGKTLLLHEDFTLKHFTNDIGLIFLEKSLPLGDTIKRVILTKQNSIGVTAMVAGWGIINDQTKKLAGILRSAKQIVRPISTCPNGGQQLPGMMCTGSTNINLPRPTHGDSGSALITENYKQIGLVAFGYLSSPGFTFYTNTSYFYDWIVDNSRFLFLLQCQINNAHKKININFNPENLKILI